jgi:hypothetical protein
MMQLKEKITIPVCFDCKHFINDGKYTCKAFPDGIPTKILISKNFHTVPLPGQVNDIAFSPKKENNL